MSKTLITPGWRNVRSFFSAFFASGSRDLFAVMSKEKMLQFDPSSCGACQVLCSPRAKVVYLVHTRFVPLCRVHMDWSTSTMSPNEYGNAGPLAIADATADFRKSMAADHPA